MATASDPPLRADAARNLERIEGAARQCFAERGLEVAVEEIARRAGVGKATLFRRFPSKDALIVAVLLGFQAEIEEIAERAREVEDPYEGLRLYLMEFVRMQARNAGFFDAVARRFRELDVPPELAERCLAANASVLEPAQRAGRVREEVGPGDLMAVLKMLGTAARPAPGSPAPEEVWVRYLDLLLAGLAPGGAPLPGREYDPVARLQGC
jgi:AcrR family transcriptional regulator